MALFWALPTPEMNLAVGSDREPSHMNNNHKITKNVIVSFKICHTQDAKILKSESPINKSKLLHKGPRAVNNKHSKQIQKLARLWLLAVMGLSYKTILRAA